MHLRTLRVLTAELKKARNMVLLIKQTILQGDIIHCIPNINIPTI